MHTADADATQLSSSIASALWTHPSAVVTILCCWAIEAGDKWRHIKNGHNDVIVEKGINIDQNSRSQTAMESGQFYCRRNPSAVVVS